jgi:hypothetical protein
MFLASSGMFLRFHSKLTSTHDGKDPNFEGHVFLKIYKVLNTFARKTEL